LFHLILISRFLAQRRKPAPGIETGFWMWSFNTTLQALFGAGLIAAAGWTAFRRRHHVRFKTFDEVAVFKELLFWAAQQLPDRERQVLTAKATMLQPTGLVALQSISREDLAVLVPFIDEWIDGKAPPQDLPAEYEDYRPRTLLAFKRRLQSKKRWPSP
jgi:hypothetical protein